MNNREHKTQDSMPFAKALKESNKPSWIEKSQNASGRDVDMLMQSFKSSLNKYNNPHD